HFRPAPTGPEPPDRARRGDCGRRQTRSQKSGRQESARRDNQSVRVSLKLLFFFVLFRLLFAFGSGNDVLFFLLRFRRGSFGLGLGRELLFHRLLDYPRSAAAMRRARRRFFGVTLIG